ncbi:uncharacterized protein LOC127856994 [Dreissena polymorpha]|uniref:Uncharacterized protein n=1 Tax=Dreissena polymorpha TaxID=45954 RepID=A0A9D3YSR6_DREPO|nr:uncharacterized protein LOC127856994 [Dreissena polymorpha]KAH3706650.1 hypothetical protein DPMN_066038 [Dreissena polymorpha]
MPEMMEEVSERKKVSMNLSDLFRAEVFWSKLRKKRETVEIPTISTYKEQMRQCQEMYDRLQLEKSSNDVGIHSTPFPLLRGHTMITQSRPLTYSLRETSKTARPVSIRSAPAFTLKEDTFLNDNLNTSVDLIPEQVTEATENRNGAADYDYDEPGQHRNRARFGPEELCEYLEQNGFGLPKMVNTNSLYRRGGQSLPRNYKSRPLPRNPSKREKIKGRARLDQEMANLRALAFCEQQTQTKTFRTASANMRNRDVLLMEEELKENMQRDGFDDNIYDDDDDDKASIVRMPIKQEELFLRINNWVSDVESTCRVYNHPHDHVRDGVTK